ncbi:MAG: tetratricopeptide repeat protein [Chlorobiaceae bacterium]|nr:tetratricopeptide repeat protein [Chlorobiaceae bacterium]
MQSNQLLRKPRILWTSVISLLDTSCGAAIDAREMLRQLVFYGYDVAVVGATVFDSEKGVSRLPENWRTQVSEKNLILKVNDAPLDHKLLITRSTKRLEMTSQEADKWYWLYVQTLEEFKPDLVFFSGGNTLELLISDEARHRGIPSAMYLANGNYMKGARWCRDVDLIITNNQTNSDYYYRQFGIKSTPVGLFIDSTAVRALTKTRTTVLFINPSLEKGAGLVIQLATLLENNRPDILFEVVESCGNWTALVRLITSHYGESPRDKLDNVMVCQNTSDMRAIYSHARLLLAPSFCWESVGRVTAEAMLNGIPAIVTDRGALPEMMGNGGFKLKLPDACHKEPYTSIIKPELLQTLAERIIQLYDDEAYYDEYVARAWHVGETLHNMANSTQRLIQAFQLLIQKRMEANSDEITLETPQKQVLPLASKDILPADTRAQTLKPTVQLTNTLEAKFESAFALQKKGHLLEAELLYKEILQLQPDHFDALQLLAAITGQRKNYLYAIDLFDQVLKIDPDHRASLNNRAVALHGLKRNEEALLCYDRIIMLKQGSAEIYCNRGTALQDLNRYEEALLSYERAIVVQPDYADAYFNLGNVLQELKRYEDAVVNYEKAILLKPDYAKAYSNQGNALRKMSRYEEALMSYDKAIAVQPDYAEAYSNRGVTLKELKRYEDAVVSYDKAIAFKPDYAEAYSNRGNALHKMNSYEEALLSYDKALAIQPDSAEVYFNRGNVLNEFGMLLGAEASYDKAIALDPYYADAYANRGHTLQKLIRYEEALLSYDKALAIQPDSAEVYINRGNVLYESGMLQAAEASYRCAMEIKQNYTDAHSNLLFCLNYSASHHYSYSYVEACRYGEIVTKKVGKPFSVWDCMPKHERLRVGLVSGDLLNHPVGYFIEGVLAQIDPSRIELIAYPTDEKADDLTARIKPFFSAWKPLARFDDGEAAHFIHADGVQILLDLAGHTAKNRLPVFAWKPAPVQVSWLGYSATTGMSQMDYYLGDPYVSPSDEANCFSEKIWRLPESYLCYTPPAFPVTIQPLPALSAGHITFGCFNNLTKVNDAVVALWSKVLNALPGSVLLLRTKQLQSSRVSEHILQRFAEQGIASGRLILDGTFSSRQELFEAYNRVDIALDSFPYTGTTTSVEGLWMGVPVITRKGNSFLSHIGESIAHNAGLADWIADNDDDYVAKAVMHTQNLECLAELRAGLRQRVLASPLFNAPLFARNFENALLDMWKQYEFQANCFL